MNRIPHLEVPQVVGWETTLKCNMRCRHCGSTAGDARCHELSEKEAQNLCKQIVDLRIPRVCLTGGETLLRRDWRAITDTLLEGGVEVGLLTNGWTFTERTLSELSSYKDKSLYVSVSLDGTPRVHDHIRCLPGSFDRAFRGSIFLREQGVPVAVITTMSHANLDCLVELRERLAHELKPYCWQLQVANSFGRAAKNDDCVVDQVEYARAVVFTCDSRRYFKKTGTGVYAGDCLGYLSSIEDGLRDSPWPGCGAGLELIGIQSNGNIKGCLSIIDDRFVEGNALTDGICEVWNKEGAFAYTRAFDPKNLHGVCAGCPVGMQCRGGCTASSISKNGEPHNAPHCLRSIETGARSGHKKPARKKVRAKTARRTRATV